VEFSVDFFRDEVRNGFYVPTAIKQAWAAELNVLSEIDRICKKHGIRYFAIYGTFLGVVRHGGFIPWDDDLDIFMLRDDYTKFREVADRELPEEYAIHDYERQEDHWLFLARVADRKRISFDPEDLNRNHNFPYISGVDIFLKDYIYEDEALEKARDEEIMYILAVAEGVIEGTLESEPLEEGLKKIEERYHITLDRKLDARHMGIELYRLAEQQMARVAPEETSLVGQIFPELLRPNGRKAHSKEIYERSIRLPFENTTIPVPASYNGMVRFIYGDILQLQKVALFHDYPYFESQRAELQSHADFELPSYRFDRSVLQARDVSSWDATHKRKVLFLAAGPMWWDSLAEYYRKECEEPETEVYVSAIPMLFKNCCGEVVATDEGLAAAAREEEYPEDLNMIPWYDLDVEELHPDRIYFQDVYDGENPCLTVPEPFYAANVRNSTKELIFIPPLSAADFMPEDGKDVYVTKHYVTAPGVVYADRVLLRTACIRDRYLDALKAWAGEDTASYWEKKLEASVATEKKRLLFMIGANETQEHPEDAPEFVERQLERFRAMSDRIETTISIYPPDPDVWTESLGDAADAVLKKIEAALDQGWCDYCDYAAATTEELTEAFDAYYGSVSPLCVEYRRLGKPMTLMGETFDLT